MPGCPAGRLGIKLECSTLHYCKHDVLMHRRGDDAFDTDYTPAEARLLLPYVIGLSGEFNNTSVALAATNLFIVSPHPSQEVLSRECPADSAADM